MWKSEIHGSDDKLPTVAQWMKSTSKDHWGAPKIVKMIWIPNLFDNYSLDTEYFRVRIGPNHGFFSVLEETLDTWVEDRSVLTVCLSDDKKPALIFDILVNERADWSPLGDYGWKLGQVEAYKLERAKTKTLKRQIQSQLALSELPEAPSNTP